MDSEIVTNDALITIIFLPHAFRFQLQLKDSIFFMDSEIVTNEARITIIFSPQAFHIQLTLQGSFQIKLTLLLSTIHIVVAAWWRDSTYLTYTIIEMPFYLFKFNNNTRLDKNVVCFNIKSLRKMYYHIYYHYYI